MKLNIVTNEKLLVEDVADKVADQIEAEEIVNVEQEPETHIEKALNKALNQSRKGMTEDFPNILLIGDAGFGKTQIVKQWAKKNNINLVYKDAKTMSPTELGGLYARDPDNARKGTKLGSTEFTRGLSKPNSVLFLDEFNRAKQEVIGSLLTLVQDHVVWDPDVEGEMLYLDNFLFTIAAINPPNSAYPGARQLDPASRSRYRRVVVTPDAQEHLRYLTKFYTDKIQNATDATDKLENEGRLKLAQTLLNSPDFYYDTTTEVEDNTDDDAYVPLNYRSLKLALDSSNGTKADFLEVWPDYCNYKKKRLVSDILKNYEDVQDKANDALKNHQTRSTVFGDKKTAADKLRAIGIDV